MWREAALSKDGVQGGLVSLTARGCSFLVCLVSNVHGGLVGDEGRGSRCDGNLFYVTDVGLLSAGGGLGGTRRGGADVNIKHSGRDDAPRYDER